jgi:MFS family permease
MNEAAGSGTTTTPGPGVLAVPPRMRFAALEVPSYRWYWALSWLSNTGDGMENVIRSYLVVQIVGLQAAPLWLGVMVFAHWVPFTFFSLYGGILADRYDGRKVVIWSQLLLFGTASAVAAATLTGRINVWWLFGLLLVHGFAGAVGTPAQQTLIHSIVGRDRLLSAVSLNSTARQFSQVVGPALAGLVFLVFGAGWGFFINALTFIPLLAFLSLLRVPRVEATAARAVLDELREGVRFVRGRPLLGSLIGIEATTVVFLGQTFSSLLVVFAAQRFPQIGPLAYPFLLVASGAGGIVGAFFLAYRRAPRRVGLFVAATTMLEMLSILLLAFSAAYAVALALMVVFGLASVLAQSLTNTTLQLSAPDRLRGRVMGAYSFGTQGLRIVNGPLLGALAAGVGVPLAFAASAALVLAVLGSFTLAVPQLRAAN